MHIPICKTTGLTTLSKYLDCQILQLTPAENQEILLGQKFYFPFFKFIARVIGRYKHLFSDVAFS